MMDSHRQRVRELLENEIWDWNQTLDLAARNALIPLLHRALKDEPAVPEAVRKELQTRWIRCVAHNSRLARELVRILGFFRDGGIDALAYKGPALAVLAHRDLSLRQMGDLDILVRRADLDRARAAMESNGYRLALTPAETEYYLTERYHLSFRGANPHVDVEIHWSITPACWRFPLPEQRLWRTQTTIDLNGASVPTLDPELTLLALCAHGGKERWARASMVVDLAELIENHPGFDWDWVLDTANRMGRARVVLLGLMLAHRLLGLRLPASVLEQAGADRSLAPLCVQLEGTLSQGGALHGVRFHRYAWKVWNHRRDRTGYLAVVVRSLPQKLANLMKPSDADVRCIAIPNRLSFLYYLVRPIRAVFHYRSLRRILKIISAGL